MRNVFIILYIMLHGIKIYTSDSVWRHILSDFGATVVDDINMADVDFDTLDIKLPASAMDINAAIMSALDGTGILNAVFKRPVHLSPLHARIVIALYKSGGLNNVDLRIALGYAPDVSTHTVDTAIYQLRKTFGRDFIINENGVYKLGWI